MEACALNNLHYVIIQKTISSQQSKEGFKFPKSRKESVNELIQSKSCRPVISTYLQSVIDVQERLLLRNIMNNRDYWNVYCLSCYIFVNEYFFTHSFRREGAFYVKHELFRLKNIFDQKDFFCGRPYRFRDIIALVLRDFQIQVLHRKFLKEHVIYFV